MEENYIVSARKYRPSTFSSVVGQKALTATLRNAIATNRLAHAYLFCGSRGVGKTSCARIFAKTINCQHPTPEGDPCNECSSCRQFNENRSLNILELDAASNNSVNDIRELTDQVLVPPTEGRYRVFIIDEVHMLSPAAFNAFLKTLEEPPEYVIFILATTEKHKIIPTILSRCQIYDFNRITIADITDHLAYVASQEGITAERAALNVIARKADGAMRDALSIFDQVAASSRGNITYQSAIDNLNVLDERYYSRLFEAFVAGDVAKALLVYKEVRDHGFDSLFFITGLAQFMRDLMVARNPQTINLLDADDALKAEMAAQAAKLAPEFFYDAMSLCNEADLNYRQASNKTFLVELLLIKLCQQSGPSPTCSGHGEGHRLQKIVVDPATRATATATPAPTSTPAAPTAAASAPVPVAAPAPQPAPQPAPAPAPIPPAAPKAAPAAPKAAAAKAHVRFGSFGLNSEEEAAAPAAAAPARNTPFTRERLLELWEQYIEMNPKAHLIANTMRASLPETDPENSNPACFLVKVANPAQVEVLEAEAPRLLQFLRDSLANDALGLRFCCLEPEEISPSGMTERDLLNHIIDTSPHIAELVEKLKLTLS